ncbi:hypothetical protein [Fluviispira vulneris]|uniref:hypothetical protein n=1 Tax=Fluviispira vulneris TaxID=2763012 RepID=UPI001647DB74|nr:hypothetical protein [Fluviispira vulneris]
MKKIIIGLMLSTSACFANNVTVNKFSIERTGGGQMETVVYQDVNHNVFAYIYSCNYKNIDKNQQQFTLQKLSGINAQEALNILNNNVILAANESLRHPNMVSGTWLNLKFEYKYVGNDGFEVTQFKDIKDPIVIINSKVSNVIHNIEEQVRINSKGICN